MKPRLKRILIIIAALVVVLAIYFVPELSAKKEVRERIEYYYEGDYADFISIKGKTIHRDRSYYVFEFTVIKKKSYMSIVRYYATYDIHDHEFTLNTDSIV